MIIETIVTRNFAENMYILGDKKGKESILIDPGGKPEQIINKIEELHLKPVRILNTHAHPDHIGAVQALQNRYSIPFMVHQAEANNVQSAAQMAQFIGLSEFAAPCVDTFFTSDDKFNLGRDQLQVIHTPGHTPGSVSFQVQDKLFSGDTLFRMSVGRTDLPGGSWSDLQQSLRGLAKLASHTKVFPGHGPTTTIGQELAHNPIYKEIGR